jgi:hypothetical protein
MARGCKIRSSPAWSRIVETARKKKSFCFFSSEKEDFLFFSEEKNQKTFASCAG